MSRQDSALCCQQDTGRSGQLACHLEDCYTSVIFILLSFREQQYTCTIDTRRYTQYSSVTFASDLNPREAWVNRSWIAGFWYPSHTKEEASLCAKVSLRWCTTVYFTASLTLKTRSTSSGCRVCKPHPVSTQVCRRVVFFGLTIEIFVRMHAAINKQFQQICRPCQHGLSFLRAHVVRFGSDTLGS